MPVIVKAVPPLASKERSAARAILQRTLQVHYSHVFMLIDQPEQHHNDVTVSGLPWLVRCLLISAGLARKRCPQEGRQQAGRRLSQQPSYPST